MVTIPNQRREGDRLALDLVIDPEPFVRATRSLGEALDRASMVVERLSWAMSGTANNERVVCGQEARLYVRAGLDRGCSSPEAIGALTRSIMDGSESAVVSMMSPENRARVAVAALRGWVTHHWAEEPTPAPIWHRHLVGTSVLVTTDD